MTDLSGLASFEGVTSFAYDQARGLLYVATASGVLYAWNPQTQSVAWSLDLGHSLSGLALSPDGTFVLVGDASVSPSKSDFTNDTPGVTHTDVYRVNLSTRAVTSLDVPVDAGGFIPAENGVSNIVIGANNQALFSTRMSGFGSGWVPFHEFSANAPSVGSGLVSGLNSITDGSYLVSSEHGRYVFVAEGDISNGPIHIYDSATDKIIASNNTYAFAPGDEGFSYGKHDINESAGLAVETLQFNTYVFDLHLNLVKTLAAPATPGSYTGSHFSQDGHQLFVTDWISDKVLVFDTSSWQQVGAIALSSQLDPNDFGSHVGVMSTSGDGRLLFVQTEHGFETVDLASKLSLKVAGEGGDNILNGSVGSDSLSGAGGNDTLTGGGGLATTWTLWSENLSISTLVRVSVPSGPVTVTTAPFWLMV